MPAEGRLWPSDDDDDDDDNDGDDDEEKACNPAADDDVSCNLYFPQQQRNIALPMF